MKNLMKGIMFLVLSLFFSSWAMADPIYVLPNESTGWQTFSITTDATISGSIAITFLVSDYGDNEVNSYLLLDNMRVNGAVVGNGGFEDGDFTGFSTYGQCSVVNKFDFQTAGGALIATYTPTEGSYMALLDTVNGDSGASTAFVGGTDGSYITFSYSPVLLPAGTTLSFDWLFATRDYHPYDDFALVKVDLNGATYAQQELAQVAPVPLPGAIYLLGSSVLGLMVIGRRRS